MVNQPLAGRARTWPLESGFWSLDPTGTGTGWVLDRSHGDQPVSGAVTRADQALLLQTASNPDAPQALYPHEFLHCPGTGRMLQRRPAGPVAGHWAPPFGSAPCISGTVRGLRQSSHAIQLTRQVAREAHDDPDALFAPPPPGDYQFISAPAGSLVPVLLALDPAKGLLCAWLPESKRWVPMKQVGGGGLAVSRLARAAWRCEVIVDGLRSLIVLPTEAGLACLRPDVLSLSYTVTYAGGAPVIGAPLQVDELIWAPLRLADGGIRFVSANVNGEAADAVALSIDSQVASGVSRLDAPLTDGLTSIWPSDTGQLLLRKPSETVAPLQASFKLWPGGVEPAFQFGSAYLSQDGRLWQLCLDTVHDQFFYLQLGVEQPDQHPATTPRPCSGRFNYRFTARSKSAPWSDPDQGTDANTREVVLPLLETSCGDVVLGLKLETTAGLEHVLSDKTPVSTVLVLDDPTRQIAFHRFKVAEPWRLRVFVHDGRVWAYHCDWDRLKCWTLQP